MPRQRTAIKALRINQQRRLRNLDVKTGLKKTIKKFKALITAKKIEEAKTGLNLAYKKLDKAAKRNVINKKTASRRKSQLAKLLIRN